MKWINLINTLSNKRIYSALRIIHLFSSNKMICAQFILLFFIHLVWTSLVNAQEHFPWPVKPFHQSHEITGTFCEFRDTGTYDHFHNGTDIPKPDGDPVYAVKDGTIISLYRSGSNAYVRVDDIAYVHIQPNPALSVGDKVVAGQTVLGTIYSGLGHVHFTYGYYGSEKNAMLPDQGFEPLNDPWAPIIRYVDFYVNNTTQKFPHNRLNGAVDIVVKVDEQNGPPSSALSRRNNGIYKIGYKILSADTSTVVYEPPSNGWRFKFDTKPDNDYVHNVFFDQLSSTTSHVYIVTNNIRSDNYWNTTQLDSGNYVVMVFAADTKGNADTAYVSVEITGQDAIPPATPVMRFTKSDQHGMEISWYRVLDSDLAGYRFYYSWDLENWKLHSKENELTADKTDTTFNVQLTKPLFFKLSAVDEVFPPNESGFSDVYGTLPSTNQARVLIVDGFDRTQSSGSWHEPAHWFATIYGQAMAANGFGFDCAANEAVLDSSVLLQNYDAVFWFLGDESTADETFSAQEQQLIKDYLEQGGYLFVSGSEIAWDLDQDNSSSGSTPQDEAFLHQYLKADYVADDSKIYQVVGVTGSIFDGLNFSYGQQPYQEDYPDAIQTVGGATPALKYNGSNLIAGLQYEGTFGQSSLTAKLVYLAFPFETIDTEEHRNAVMGRVLNFFFDLNNLAENPVTTVRSFSLAQNYPNPFNNQTVISFTLPQSGRAFLTIYDMNGRLVRILNNQFLKSGYHQFTWDGRDGHGRAVASGIYFYRLRFGKKATIRKMLLVK